MNLLVYKEGGTSVVQWGAFLNEPATHKAALIIDAVAGGYWLEGMAQKNRVEILLPTSGRCLPSSIS